MFLLIAYSVPNGGRASYPTGGWVVLWGRFIGGLSGALFAIGLELRGRAGRTRRKYVPVGS
ncbi:hypothetical protein C1933_19850 [Stenotrophomonas sp. ZAC14D2_NAIMI4_6]|nr:hypothetical protein C1933_19850 [Stenotrophomonas sp. ZAC14D2_NAIMI4_6]